MAGAGGVRRAESKSVNFMIETSQDSRPDTLAHIARVADLLQTCMAILEDRAIVHDASKLEEPEKSAFDRLKALSLSGMAYGSEEYRACLRAERPAIQHHYAHNSHHPEFFPPVENTPLSSMLRACAEAQEEQATAAKVGSAEDSEAVKLLFQTAKRIRASADEMEASVNGMSLFDVLEMLMDWKAATERMKDGGDIHASLIHNTDRFKLSPQLAAILANTVREMNWPKKDAATSGSGLL